jgi:hypothetical protein
MAALDEAGVEPEVFLPEYGRDQFEISCDPVARRGRRRSRGGRARDHEGLLDGLDTSATLDRYVGIY